MINFDEVDLDSLKTRHRTAPIPGTMTSVPHYPKKLKVYMHNASPIGGRHIMKMDAPIAKAAKP
jgi:hypothetical protein